MKSISAPKSNFARTPKQTWICWPHVNTFVLDEDANHIRVLTMGTHDKAFMRTVAKKFPKDAAGIALEN